LTALLVRYLDNPKIKDPLKTLVRDKAGLELDFATTQVRVFSGLRITDVVVRSPTRFREVAPELLRVGSITVRWSLPALLHHQYSLSSVYIEDVRAVVVRDADGRTSLSELGAAEEPAPRPPGPPSPPASPPTPLSQLFAKILAGSPPLNEATVHKLALTLLLRDAHHAVERLQLSAPDLWLRLSTASAPGGWQVQAHIGAESAPVALHVQRSRAQGPAGQATAELWLDARLAPQDAKASVDLRVRQQTLLPTLQLSHLIHAEARARFDGKAGRVEVALAPLMLADEAVKLSAEIELPDPGRGPITLRTARGAANLQPLYSTLSAEVTPLHAQRFLLDFDVAGLPLSAAPRLAPGGHARVHGDIEALRIMLGGEDLTLAQGKVSLTAEPTADHGTAIVAELPLSGLRTVRDGVEHALGSLHIAVSGRADHEGALTGDADLRLAGLLQATGSGPAATRLALRGGHLAVHANDLRLDLVVAPTGQAPPPPHTPTLLKHRRLAQREVHGLLTANGQLEGLGFVSPGLRSDAGSIGIAVQAHLAGGPPYGLDLDLPIIALKVRDGKDHVLHDGPLHLSAHTSEVYPDPAEPRRTRGDLAFAAALADVTVELAAHKHPDSVDFEVNADAKSLTTVRTLLAASGGTPGFELPWESMGLTLHSQGQLQQLFGPDRKLDQHTEINLSRPALKSATGQVAAQGLSLTASTSGNTRRQSGALDLNVRGLKVGDQAFDDVHVGASGDVDLGAPALRLNLSSKAKAGPQASLSTTLAFDRRKKALTYDFAMQAAKLLPLQPFLAKVRSARGFDLSALELSLKGSGTIVGLLDDIGPSLVPRIHPHLTASLGVNGTFEVRAGGVYWNEGDRVVKSPLFGWRATLSHQDQIRKLHGELQLDALHVEFGEHELDFGKVEDSLDLAMLGDLNQGVGELTQHLKLGELQQDFLSGYVLSGLVLSLRASRNHDGEIQISELKLQNDGGGTEMDLTGHVELGSERRSVHLRGTLNQQLDRLWNKSEVYVGHGAVALNVNVHSGNFTLFHTQAEVQVTDGNLRLPRRGVLIENFSGEVPIIADVLVDGSGFHLVPSEAPNMYSQLRYADQHPLLTGRSFISVGRVATPLFDVAGLAGNLRIEHTLISLSQFELAVRGGQVSGQCLLDVRDDAPTLQMRIRASHITASHGERFDGNAAVVVGVRDRSVSGRSEILRIGRRHLLDLLDLHDPQHTDPAVNRVRTALAVGYPDRVSLAFDHGFATARISLGGLAGMVRIDPLRGIPMGPIIDKLLPPVADTEDDQ
jgi:hypothetical protein